MSNIEAQQTRRSPGMSLKQDMLILKKVEKPETKKADRLLRLKKNSSAALALD